MTDSELGAALRAFAEGDLEQASLRAQRAAETGDLVARAASAYVQHLRLHGARHAYDGDAFAAFIRGGGNQRLYRATVECLRSIYRELPAGFALVDIGAGDGLALVPAVSGFDATVLVIEPAANLLATATRALEVAGVRHECFAQAVEDFIESHGDRRFDLIQSTFALQSLPRDRRRDALAWCRRAAPQLAIVEFDAPQSESALEPGYLGYVIDRYRRGIAEYGDPEGLVVQGFLMPVMFGYFTQGRARTNHEQPLDAWIADVRDAGFGEVAASAVDDYWWAPALLLRAR